MTVYCNNRTPPLVRFERGYVPDPNSGCWLWIGAVRPTKRHTKSGVVVTLRPTMMVGGRTQYAYRVGYELLVGNIPKGKLICHRCNVSICVNPNHLYPGDGRTNAMDCVRAGKNCRHNASKTHCRHGHPFSEENTVLRHGSRVCMACTRRYHREHRKREKARLALTRSQP